MNEIRRCSAESSVEEPARKLSRIPGNVTASFNTQREEPLLAAVNTA